MDEKPVLSEVIHEIAMKHGNYPDVLNVLSSSDIEYFREVYWGTASKYTSLETGTFLVDKQPFNIIHCNLIARLFPNAKVIVNLRHPCDVCLSCFMQNFLLDDALAHFTTLEDTVQLYSDVMGLWLQYEQILPLSFHRFRYEGLIEGFKSELETLVDFLGITWSDSFQDHHLHAAEKKAITSASYAQVVEPRYTKVNYRWQRYRQHLEPYLPVLQDYIEDFGYDDV